MSSSHLKDKPLLGRSALSARLRHSCVLLYSPVHSSWKAARSPSEALIAAITSACDFALAVVSEASETAVVASSQSCTSSAKALAWSIRYGRLGKPSLLV